MNEELRDEVAGAIPVAALGCCVDCPMRHDEDYANEQAREIADVLMPLLERREREAAARTLREALADVKTHNGRPVSQKNLRWAATHEALCRSYIFDVLMGLADALDRAEALVPLLERRERETAALAWNEGHRAGIEHQRTEGQFIRFVETNPYRTDASTEETS